MVAYNPRFPRDDRRSISAPIAQQLHASLTSRWTDPASDESALNAAIVAAAEDARARGLRPEELLLALKAVEEDVATALDVENTQDRDRFRMWLVAACMRAFFGAEPPTNS